MDPNSTLAEIRAAIADWREAGRSDYLATADDIVSAIEALDEWLVRGGFMPAAWSRGTR